MAKIKFNPQDPSGCLCGTESMISSICPLVKHCLTDFCPISNEISTQKYQYFYNKCGQKLSGRVRKLSWQRDTWYILQETRLSCDYMRKHFSIFSLYFIFSIFNFSLFFHINQSYHSLAIYFPAYFSFLQILPLKPVSHSFWKLISIEKNWTTNLKQNLNKIFLSLKPVSHSSLVACPAPACRSPIRFWTNCTFFGPIVLCCTIILASLQLYLFCVSLCFVLPQTGGTLLLGLLWCCRPY